jgi:two-component system NtrC family sensor kinase
MSAPPDNTLADPEQLIADLQRQLAECKAERDQALQRETATAEVLQVINSSPGDLGPVFDSMLEKATRLCDAAFGIVQTYDGEAFHAMAHYNSPPQFVEFLRTPLRPMRGMASYRIVRGEDVVTFDDIAADPVYASGSTLTRRLVELTSARSHMTVALRKDGVLLGEIVMYRREVRPFTDKQVALVKNFAAQAVIAMENARLITELRRRTRDLQESLEYQTATSEVLKVISRSAFDLETVLRAVVTTAVRLCRADSATIYRNDNGEYRWAAGHMLLPDYEQIERSVRIRPGTGTLVGRVATERQTVQILDAWTDPLYEVKDDARIGGVHTMIGVPLLREGSPIGVIGLARRRVEAFSERESQLVTAFADQAVIAIENARLFNDLRQRTRDLQESLEYQTATSDVLKVISQSGAELDAVLNTLVETATRICDGVNAIIFRLRDDERLHFVASYGVATEYRDFLIAHPHVINHGTLVGRTASERRVVHIVDVAADPAYTFTESQRRGELHTMLGVPLMREGALLGVLALNRKHVEPFTEKQIALVATFADQAVIAIENARLITETREALAQQTATAEVLQVINSSPGDLAPVFDAILYKAHSLCAVAYGSLELYDGESFRAVAVNGLSAAFADMLQRGYRAVDNPATRPLIEGDRLTHIADLAETDYSITQSAAELERVRTLLCVPLRRDDLLLGMIASARQEVRPFSEKEIALLESFAAQAVIAMDNARLVNEIRQRQAELRVTFDNMGDGVAMFDGELRLAAWNLNFQRILNLPDALLAERPSYANYIRTLAGRGEFGAVDIEAELSRRLEGIDQELRLEHTRPDGRVIEVRRNAVPGGGFVVIYSDITERKRAETEIRAARDAAERALRELQTAQASLVHAQKMAALGQLTAGIAHEIKNPLNFVNNFADLSVELLDELKESAAPALATLGPDKRAEIDETIATVTGNLAKIAEHGKRADGIVKSMLEHSRGVSGERRVVDLNALVEEALNLAYHGARAQDASFNITLDRDFDRSLVPVELAPQEMTRVFLNLFGNGFYAATRRQRDGGGLDFRPTLRVATRDLGAAVEVRVRDNGTGIAPEIRDRLFQPFVSTKPTGEGTGLGLSIAWDIVTQQHGGTIAIDSVPGEFTEFTIRLPRTHLAPAETAS